VKRNLKRRLHMVAVTAVAIAGAGYLLHATTQVSAPQDQSRQDQGEAGPLVIHFQHGVEMLNAGRYPQAAEAFHRVLRLAPTLPEAHVNMGFALLGAGDADAAMDFFGSAIDLRPTQANAYFGLAEALELRGDLEAALGAMRAYVHLSNPDDPYLDRARAALWEWEALLGDAGDTAGDADRAAVGGD
jgi:Flp pilus assembly protein TadD